MMTPDSDFDLIETLRWQRGRGYYLLERHLERLVNSADALGFECARAGVLDHLNQAVTDFASPVERVRLLLRRDGAVTLTHTAITLAAADHIMTFAISDKTTDSRDDLLRHKTTRRQLYDSERSRLQEATGCDEAVFMNERGEFTEGSITTIFIERDGVLKTPLLASGVLPGTLRAELFADKDTNIEEARLTLTDLRSANSIFLGNSVRGLIKARQI